MALQISIKIIPACTSCSRGGSSPAACTPWRAPSKRPPSHPPRLSCCGVPPLCLHRLCGHSLYHSHLLFGGLIPPPFLPIWEPFRVVRASQGSACAGVQGAKGRRPGGRGENKWGPGRESYGFGYACFRPLGNIHPGIMFTWLYFLRFLSLALTFALRLNAPQQPIYPYLFSPSSLSLSHLMRDAQLDSSQVVMVGDAKPHGLVELSVGDEEIHATRKDLRKAFLGEVVGRISCSSCASTSRVSWLV